MKLRNVTLSLVLALSSTFAASAELAVPSGFSKLKNGDGVDLYKDSDGEVFVQVVDLQSGASISLDGFANVASHSQNTFYREKLTTLYNNHYSSDLFSAVNGQFFDNQRTTTGVAFPVKANGTIKSEAMWDSLAKRTFMIDYNGYAYIQDGYNDYYLESQGIKETLVGLNPSVNKSGGYAIGRTYIGAYSPTCNPKYATCMFPYVLFFIAENKTQAEMADIATRWRVSSKALVMMDGSGSSQIKSGSYSLYGSKVPNIHYPDKRTLPHVILTYENGSRLAPAKHWLGPLKSRNYRVKGDDIDDAKNNISHQNVNHVRRYLDFFTIHRPKVGSKIPKERNKPHQDKEKRGVSRYHHWSFLMISTARSSKVEQHINGKSQHD